MDVALGISIGLIVGFFIGCWAYVAMIRDAIKAGFLENKGKAYRIIPWSEQVKG